MEKYRGGGEENRRPERLSKSKSENRPLSLAATGQQACPVTKNRVDQVELAATAIKLNVRLRSSDMPAHMQQHALSFTRSLLDSAQENSRLNPTHLARALKKEFDASYGLTWHCVIGKSFGSYVTHSSRGFVYFSIDSLSVLLFKTVVHVATEHNKP